MGTKSKALNAKISTIILAAIIIIVAIAIAFNLQTSTNSTTTILTSQTTSTSTTSTTSTTITTTSTTTTTQITSTGKLQLKLNKVEYEIAKEETDPNIWKMTLEYTNTDTTDITIGEILVNNNSIKAYPIEDQIELPITLAKGSTDILTFKIPASKDYKPNQTIEVKLKSTTGTEYSIQILLKY
ncbi:MAG: hypothetical protein QXV52_08155 [Nitrososphaeria archaeon]